jgi:hypothetical protein
LLGAPAYDDVFDGGDRDGNGDDEDDGDDDAVALRSSRHQSLTICGQLNGKAKFVQPQRRTKQLQRDRHSSRRHAGILLFDAKHMTNARPSWRRASVHSGMSWERTAFTAWSW